jgi:hypothetical protein
MKKSLSESSNAQPVVINNTTNVSNRETTVMPGSDKAFRKSTLLEENNLSFNRKFN